ncbi:MAG: glycoside hydrolase family 15 protein [Capsulimonadaceae bacterium]
MPRDIPIGNGNLLITFDSRYTLRDIYFPYVGQENHTRGQACRFGVWVDGQLSWIHEPSWHKQLRYENETLVTAVTAVHWGLGIRLTCRDCVDFDRDLYIRKVEIENLLPMPRDVRLFWHHDFNIWASSEGNTAYYAPNLRSMVHYKGKCWLLANVCVGSENPQYGVEHYAVGVSRAHGAEGTWRDAEDGVLGMNAIAQGSVDSTIGAHVKLNRCEVVYYWLAAGEDYQAVKLIDGLVRERGPEFFLHRVRTYWNRWVNKDNIPYGDLPEPLVTLYKQSLLILRTQIDNRGAIIAANDSDYLDYNNDTYSYMWPRDGALVAFALDMAGQPDVTRNFYEFCKDVLLPEGCLLHKYNPDKSLGSSWHPWADQDGNPQLPIQEDETALVIWALWEHYDRYKDVEFIRPLYSPLIRRAGEFMESYREPHTCLPGLSYDLWEERHGIHTFTVATVWAGLNAAANFAETFGDEDRAVKFRRSMDAIKKATIKHLWYPEEKRFVRRLTIDRHTGLTTLDLTIDASVYGLFQFGMFAADDPMVVSTMTQIEERLWCRTDIGGIARYENDYYHQVSQDVANVPGNPWIICTLWLAEWYIAKARSLSDLGRALEIIEWVRRHTLDSGVLAEQIHPYSGDPISVSPLAWSHATVVMTVREYLAKLDFLCEAATKEALLSGDIDMYELAE